MTTTHPPLARRLPAGLEAMEVDQALSVFIDHAEQQMPFARDGFPPRLDRSPGCDGQHGGLPSACRSVRSTVERVFKDADAAVVEGRGVIAPCAHGRRDNHDMGIFAVPGGRVVRYTEHVDPRVFQEPVALLTGSFALDNGASR